MWVDRSSHWQRLCSRLTRRNWLAHQRDWLLTCLCSRLTKLTWIQIESNRIWWHRLFWLDWFTSFLREKREVCDSLAINDHMFSLILLIEWINATEWAVDSLAIQQSCRWFYWFSDVVLSFDCVDHQIKQISLYSFRCSLSVLNEYWYSYHRINEFLV